MEKNLKFVLPIRVDKERHITIKTKKLTGIAEIELFVRPASTCQHT
jgi:hypothetical protein